MMVNLAGTWNNLGVGVWGVARTNKYSRKGFSRRSQEGSRLEAERDGNQSAARMERSELQPG